MTQPELLSEPCLLYADNVATMDDERHDPDYGHLEDAALVVNNGIIQWIGPKDALPDLYHGLRQSARYLQGWLTPGLIDCHTHIVHGGNRAREFEQRLTGVSYEEIARQGGGIVSTVRATREADLDALIDSALPRVRRLMSEGVTSMEIKSGYGLDFTTEIRMLRAAREIEKRTGLSIATTHLGAHALPAEFADRPDAYIDTVCIPCLQEAAAEGLVDAVDVFCEGIGFSPEQCRRVFDAAQKLGLPVKIHAEQLSDLGGASLAAEFAALSADHLEYLNARDAAKMANAGTVAVLLPGAYYFLRETRMPPVDVLRELGVPMAIATDNNPGSSPVTSLLLMLNMGCTLFALTPAEVLQGVTRNGARALGLTDRGMLREGKRADMALWSIGHPAELACGIGHNPLIHSFSAQAAV